MASAVEQWESRTGDVSADRSGFGASREFYVVIDNIGDNPDDVLRDPAQVGANAVPQGEPHPTRTGLIAAFYIVQRPRITAYSYKVLVVYAPPVTFGTAEDNWEWNWQPGLTSAVVRHDFFGNAIGPAVYELRNINEPQPGQIYSVTVPPVGDASAETLQLVRTDDLDTEPVRHPQFLHDANRAEPVGSFSATRVFSGLNRGAVPTLQRLGSIINLEPWDGWPKQTVMYLGASIQAGWGTDPTTNSEGFVWRITLVFEWNFLGYRWTAQDLFHNSDGNRYPVVQENGEPMMREWILYGEGTLSNLQPLVENYAAGYVQPTRIPPGR